MLPQNTYLLELLTVSKKVTISKFRLRNIGENSFDATIDIKILFFRVSITVEQDRSLLTVR
jgi:hypothetical protein